MREIAQIFVVFSEKLKFNPKSIAKKNSNLTFRLFLPSSLLHAKFVKWKILSMEDSFAEPCLKYIFSFDVYRVESVQDFLIKLDIKPLMHLLEINSFSPNNVIVRLNKIMNRADKNWAHF